VADHIPEVLGEPAQDRAVSILGHHHQQTYLLHLPQLRLVVVAVVVDGITEAQIM
jgi:hypothetical protein